MEETTINQFAYSASDAGGIMAMGMGMLIFMLAIIVFMIIALWKIYTKAGKPGWACIVPVYNYIVLLQIAGKPIWWIVWFILPVVGALITTVSPAIGGILYLILVIIAIVFSIMMYHGLSKSFGKGAGFTVGLILLGIIFFPILAFGKAKYIGAGGNAQQA